MNVDINAEIIPYKESGGIKLYSTIDELKSVLSGENVSSEIFHDEWMVYDIDNYLKLFFSIKNSKLFKIVTLEEYKGKLFGEIGVGTSEEEFLRVEPSFWYDEFEEVWVSPKGIFIETDGATNLAVWISVFIPELESEQFHEYKW